MCVHPHFINVLLYYIGSSSGSVQVFDLSVGLMIREFNLHSAPVRYRIHNTRNIFILYNSIMQFQAVLPAVGEFF